MTRLVLQQVTDFGDYICGKELSELLKQTNLNCKNTLSDVRLSPDGRHIHVILSQPKVGLMTFDKYERPQFIQVQKHQSLAPTRTVPIVDIVYLDPNNNRQAGVATVVLVYEDGKAEFWKFLECKAGWHLVQTSDLCNGPRARVVSVSACSNLIIWCEERPPSESLSVANATINNMRYCICKRAYEVEEGAVSLGGVKVTLHNNPRFTVVSSGEHVYLLPYLKENHLLSINKLFLSWHPQHDTFTVISACEGAVLKQDSPSPKENDFRKLVMDCLGYLSALAPPAIHGFSPSACGGLLLLLSTGWVSLLQRDGLLRRVYKMADNCPVSGGAHNSLRAYQDTLALAVGRTLYLIDLRCGREVEKISLGRESLLFADNAERPVPRLLSELGLHAVLPWEADGGGHDAGANPKKRAPSAGASLSVRPGTLLVEAVFEEACAYYQQRSLSSTQLTVDKLKKGGMFQAPISLASILGEFLSEGAGGPRGAEPPNPGGGEGWGGQDKLLGFLEAELKTLVSLEEVKGRLARGSEEEAEVLCEALVRQEVARLLSCEPDGEALLYLNSIFRTFPSPAWSAAQAALQLHGDGEGSLSSAAPPEVWKTALSPAPGPSPANLPYSNGHGVQKQGAADGCPAGRTLPVFELLCSAVLHIQPEQLPRFLELAQQQQQGQAGLGLNLASSSPPSPSAWSCGGRAGEGAGEGIAVPLYKRALSVLPEPALQAHEDLAVELLLVSGRPNAVLQALRVLVGRRRWERVAQVARRFCRQSPLLSREMFTAVLPQVAQHRELDPYADALWALCPDDLPLPAVLRLLLPNAPPPPPSPGPSPAAFAQPGDGQLCVGLLKPLLAKLLRREGGPSQRYADILQSPVFPPPAPPRQPAEAKAAARRSMAPARGGSRSASPASRHKAVGPRRLSSSCQPSVTGAQ